MKIILATRNQSKMRQIGASFEGSLVSLMSLDDAGIEGEAVEDGATLEENALKKALFAQKHSSMWSMADDTGFFIDALDGKPGIFAARWAGEGKTTEEVMRHTLERLQDVPIERRGAFFQTVAVLVSPSGEHVTFAGKVKGAILFEPRTACQPKMPYSAIFLPEGQPKVWAEMSVEEENAISHRGQAFRKVREYLERTVL